MAKPEYNSLPVKELNRLFRYEPDTGKLFWRGRPRSDFANEQATKTWNIRFANTQAGSVSHRGYRMVNVAGKLFCVHRVVYAMYHGEHPEGQIDHWNGARDDNRISNLRDVSQSQNNKNTKMSPRNTSGVTGVHWDKSTGKWMALIRHEKETRYLGVFDTLDAAARARGAAEKELGYTLRHGKVG